MEIAGITNKRNIIFISFSIISLIIFYLPFKELLRHSFHEELYSHIILVPFVSGYFIFLKRKQIRLGMGYSLKIGSILLITGILLYFIGEQRGGLNSNDHLSLMIFSALVFWIGGFILFYGLKAFKIASFSLLFLFFMIPIPSKVVEAIISILQAGSAEAAYGFFKLTGVPVLREGFIFNLPGMSIEIAKQCSGIRSSIALVITSIIAGQLFLQTNWRKCALVLSAIPIAIMKNGLRIVTLSLLATYVDPRILGSELHKSGGIPFFILALGFLAPILWWLRRTERAYSAAKKVVGKGKDAGKGIEDKI